MVSRVLQPILGHSFPKVLTIKLGKNSSTRYRFFLVELVKRFEESIEPCEESFKTSNSNMEEDLCHVQQALEGLEQQLSCKGYERLKKRRGSYLGTKSSQTLETTSRPLSYSNLKLPLCGTFGPYDYEA
ncbi:hypothetical protein M9H77_17784 [Catharanthus roseus]|uniref:Uncharacterized protein n=1 Tax=Catharanthus roseus TaxID=4058 RepID=A0ACC0B5L8_CATRO|nr:hypothetical protein M9H77_17784 [Catharanthus roseus]